MPPLPPRADMGRSSYRASIISLVISVAMLVAVAMQFHGMNAARIFAMIPRNLLFWLVFAAYYLAGPASEWVIYRRLWGIPISGMLPLLRKLVTNELLLGYLGEVQFYGWARQRGEFSAAPFGAIKDVTILSALVGNGITLVMLLVAWPMLGSTEIGPQLHSAFLALSVVLITSGILLFFRKRLFSLPVAMLREITAIHIIRTLGILGISALLWHLVIPSVPLSWWLILATLRMLVSRLPLIPNKDIFFAGMAVFLLGHDVQIAELLTMMAGIILVAHLAVGAVVGAHELLEWKLRK